MPPPIRTGREKPPSSFTELRRGREIHPFGTDTLGLYAMFWNPQVKRMSISPTYYSLQARKVWDGGVKGRGPLAPPLKEKARGSLGMIR